MLQIIHYQSYVPVPLIPMRIQSELVPEAGRVGNVVPAVDPDAAWVMDDETAELWENQILAKVAAGDVTDLD